MLAGVDQGGRDVGGVNGALEWAAFMRAGSSSLGAFGRKTR